MNNWLSNIVILTFVITSNAIIPSRRPNKNITNKRKHLDLVWNIRKEIDNCELDNKKAKVNICQQCGGDGELLCRFCRGTGFFMLSDVLLGTENDCPVCNGTGLETCKSCMGAGKIAIWHDSYSNTLLNE